MDASETLPDPAVLKAASEAGNAEAAHALAVLAGIGFRMPQDWGLALAQLERAAALGSASAQAQVTLLSDARGIADLSAWLAPPRIQPLSDQPRILTLPGFITPETCDWIIGRASDRMAAAEVFDPATGLGRRHAVRSNSACAFQLMDLDMILVLLRERILRATGLPPFGLEPLQVLKYEPGQSFDWHVDYLTPDQPGLARDLAEKGQRIATALVYLTDDYEGGETAFESNGLRHRGARGDAVLWANTLPDGRPDLLTRHAGLPPTKGVKWVVSQWCRGGPPRR